MSAVGITLVLSYFVYEYFEKYFIRLGKKKFLSAK
jgi:peptidoglycan/LPS O-acetylase OafA/YrhL